MNSIIRLALTRRFPLLAVLAAVAAGPLPSRAEVFELIPLTGAVWRFNQSSNLDGVNWTAPAYIDTNWQSGPSLLAFENNGDLTPLIFTTLNDPRTAVAGVQGHAYYFRIHFDWPYTTNKVTLRFTCRIDDCATFYLNGVLLTNVGVNTPGAFASYGRAALGAGSEATVDEEFTLAPASLVTGDNVLAVAVHQLNASSSDIVWGARLTGEVDNTPPFVANSVPSAGAIVHSLDSVQVVFNEAVRNVNAADLLVNGQPATNLLVAAAHDYVFQFPPPPTGTVHLAFAAGHGITDAADNAFAGTNWICRVDPTSGSLGPVTDHFNQVHDYLAEGLVGTIWEGLYTGEGDIVGGATGGGAGATLVADAHRTRAGALTVQSTQTDWEGGGDDGFFLFKTVTGDFRAEVRIVNFDVISYNCGGLMARAPRLSDAGAGEDYVTWFRFDEFNIANYRRSVDNGGTDNQWPGNFPNTNFFLRLERVGNTFNFYEKGAADDPWTLAPGLSVTRADLSGLPLEVGIMQAAFSGNSPVFQFGQFSLEGPQVNVAGEPSPAASLVFTAAGGTALKLSWTPAPDSSGSLVLLRASRPLSRQPADAIAYRPHSVFAAGEDLGGGNYVVYAGSGSSVTVTNLSGGVRYYGAVYSFTGSGSGINYTLTTPAAGTVMGPGLLQSLTVNVPTNLVPGAYGQATVRATFDNGSSADVTALSIFASSAPSVVAVDGAGQLQAFAYGSAVITATFEGHRSSNTVHVVEPPPPVLAHRYNFEGQANDLVGTAHGVLQSGAFLTNGALALDGALAYLDLPDNLVTGYTSVTFETWALNAGSGGWARVWDFGNAPGVNLLLTWPSGEDTLRVVYNQGSGEQQVNAILPPDNEMLHIVFTQDGATRVARLYVDGVLVGENTAFTLTPAAIGATANDWLGRSQYADPYFNGRIDEFRIYRSALTAAQVEENFLAGPDAPPGDGPVTLLRQPGDATVVENTSATFSVLVQGHRPYALQWFKNGQPIPGANTTKLSFAPVFADDLAVIQLWATNTVDGTNCVAASSNAVLRVLADTNPPTLMRVVSAGTDALSVLFSEPITSSSATALTNYNLQGAGGAVALNHATLSPDGLTVTLGCAPLTYGASYTLVVNHLQDRAAVPNTIAPNSSAHFAAASLELRDIGTPSFVSQINLVDGGYDITAGGTGFSGKSDQFTLGFQNYAGDFDVAVRLADLRLSDVWARAGLMARDGLATNAAFAATWATPGPVGCLFQTRTLAGTTNGSLAGSFPVNHPDTWLRLRRAGSDFSGYASLDGQNWAPLGSATVGMSFVVQVGLAVSANSATATTTAAFRDFGSPAGLIVTNPPLPFEPMAPCSRKTGLVISEIMYNPPDAWSTSRLEFVEIHNPDLFFEDLSGYRLEGDLEFTFPPGTVLPSGGYLLLARDPGAIRAYYGLSDVLGPYTNNLPNGGGTIRLVNDVGGWVLEVNYNNNAPWPVAADGAGHSLVLRRPSYGEADPRAWGPSDRIGGSPGHGDGWGAESLRGVVINEFLANSDAPGVADFVELYNASNLPVDLSGAWLSDAANTNLFRIPDGTVLGPRGFISFDQSVLGFALNSQGEQIYLVNSNRTRVIDAVRFGAQAPEVSRGRSPDGSPLWSELAAATPGANNTAPLARGIVINEIMYHPISDSDDDEYVELYNRGPNGVDLAGWRLSGGISFTFPANLVVPPNGYVVAAKNLTNLLAKYPQLTPANTCGDFGGALKNSGERIVLEMPLVTVATNGGVITTNVSYIAVYEVTYGTGGRWGRWSDGGGSSLELVDPRADARFAPNWADSDESAKAPWTTVDFTGLLDNGMSAGNGTPNRFEFFLQDAGECLVDDLQCISGTGANLITNPGFENNLTGWAFQGTHRLSYLETNGAYAGAKSLHVVAVERGDAGPNRIRTGITTMPTGVNGTIRAKVRWLRGTRDILFRVRGHWIEAPAVMAVPAHLGTPGLPNSRRVANAGPAIVEVTHQPVAPAAGQLVVVSARISDPDGPPGVALTYSPDPNPDAVSVPMRDDGTGGDALAGDGVYSATIPGQPAQTMIAFHIVATDTNAGAPASSRFPNDAPARECLVNFGEAQPYGGLGTYRVWMKGAGVAAWNTRERNSNEPIDCTFAYGNTRVIYNAGALYSGSPWHTANHPYTGPLGNVCDYELNFADDEAFLGATDFVLNGQGYAQNFFENDLTGQAEYTAYWLARQIGLGYDHRRAVRVFFNGQPRGMVYFDHQQPNREIVSQYYRDDDQGHLHKIEDWFEFDDGGNGFDIITATLQNFTTTGGAKKTGRYRWTWRPRAVSGSPNDFADLFRLVDAVNGLAGDLVSATSAVMDTEQWMRHFAFQHAIGNWDTYGYNRGKNCFAYKPTRGPWRLLVWDVDLVLGKGSDGPTTPLLSTGGSEPVIQSLYNTPFFARAFWRAIHDLATGPMLAPNYGPWMQDRYAAYRAHGVAVQDPTSVASWIDARRNYMLTQIPQAGFDVTNFVRTTNLLVTLTGSAPVTVARLTVDGTAWPITWTDGTHWRLTLPVNSGTNRYLVQGYDQTGQAIPSASNVVTIASTAPPPDAPPGNVVVNEIMFAPAVPDADYVEVFNRSASTPFDLSNWQFNGLAYRFPPDTFLPPRSFLVLAKDRAAFASAYGLSIPVFDVFPGALQSDGETLSLLQPGATTNLDRVVDQVKFEAAAPWPAGGTNGASLQLMDAAQDNSRVCNWSDSSGWRFVSYSGAPAGVTLYLYLEASGDVYLDGFSLVPGTVPAVGSNYLKNADFELALTNGWRMQGNVTNSVISTSVKRSGNASLRFVVGNPAGTSARLFQSVSGLAPANTYTLSFWYLPTTGSNTLTAWFSSSFMPRASLRPIAPTPGTNNAVAATLPPIPPLWLNEVQPFNLTGFTDHAGQREPWIELFNAGTNAVNLEGLYLADNYTNLTQWAFPAGAVIQPGEFQVIVADGDPEQATPAEPHTSFRLSPTNGALALARVRAGQPEVLDYLNYAGVPADCSWGSVPDGQPFARLLLNLATPGAANADAQTWPPLRLNEWLASNTGLMLDPADNDADDWFEIYNPTALAVNLAGWSLTDDLSTPGGFRVPGGYTVRAHGHLLVWADGESGQNAAHRPDLHVNFKLEKNGEALGLFAPDGTLVDAVTFGLQSNNVSQGRSPDGSTNLAFFATPTPGAENSLAPRPAPVAFLAVSGDLVAITFSTIPGLSYRVEYKQDLTEAPWTPLAPALQATGTTLSVHDTLGNSRQRFYRVVVP